MNVVVQMVVLEHICTWLMLIFRFIAERWLVNGAT